MAEIARFLVPALLGIPITAHSKSIAKGVYQIDAETTLSFIVTGETSAVLQWCNPFAQWTDELHLSVHGGIYELIGAIAEFMGNRRRLNICTHYVSFSLSKIPMSTKDVMSAAVSFLNRAYNHKLMVLMQTLSTFVLSIGHKNALGVLMFSPGACTTTWNSASNPRRHPMPDILTFPSYMFNTDDTGEAVVEVCRVLQSLADQISTVQSMPETG